MHHTDCIFRLLKLQCQSNLKLLHLVASWSSWSSLELKSNFVCRLPIAEKLHDCFQANTSQQIQLLQCPLKDIL